MSSSPQGTTRTRTPPRCGRLQREHTPHKLSAPRAQCASTSWMSRSQQGTPQTCTPPRCGRRQREHTPEVFLAPSSECASVVRQFLPQLPNELQEIDEQQQQQQQQ
eukprot:TRINITY_DN96233_c0_g1_i1.p3 TRINITY_DN96233_c0_g1~~TRINITY_DN96233_c0_g1_i1.p3  ORF type:complete len:106 (-),score=15.92 TRINITY_DN96233_c0_g1_i1:49-366(-)